MQRLDPLVRFAVLFLLAYALLIAPWPGWNRAYGGFFRGFARVCLAHDKVASTLRFAAAENPPRPELDLVIAFSTSPATNGSRAEKWLGLDSRGVGWVPTALLIALTLATPVSWPRRLATLAAGLALLHLYLLLALSAYIWNESGGLLPVAFIPFSPGLGQGLEETLVIQLGPSFIVPVVIWLATNPALLTGPWRASR